MHDGTTIPCVEEGLFYKRSPYPQAGSPVSIEADINYSDNATLIGDPTITSGANLRTGTQVAGTDRWRVGTAEGERFGIDNIDGINFTVEELRRATALQRFLENTIRGGNRYFEHLLVHWGVKSRDARLQRPEYLGGGLMPVQISDTANTTGTIDAPQSTLSGNGLSIGKSNNITKYCEEHGYIMLVISHA